MNSVRAVASLENSSTDIGLSSESSRNSLDPRSVRSSHEAQSEKPFTFQTRNLSHDPVNFRAKKRSSSPSSLLPIFPPNYPTQENNDREQNIGIDAPSSKSEELLIFGSTFSFPFLPLLNPASPHQSPRSRSNSGFLLVLLLSGRRAKYRHRRPALSSSDNSSV